MHCFPFFSLGIRFLHLWMRSKNSNFVVLFLFAHFFGCAEVLRLAAFGSASLVPLSISIAFDSLAWNCTRESATSGITFLLLILLTPLFLRKMGLYSNFKNWLINSSSTTFPHIQIKQQFGISDYASPEIEFMRALSGTFLEALVPHNIALCSGKVAFLSMDI